nr:hypothetical protein GCM10025699_13180 [Microbacterium flavescens]
MTPIASPRFSNGNTCSIPGRAERAAVRSAQASITVRARVTVCVPNEPECSGLKHTTSQRPTDVRVRPRPGASRSARPPGASMPAGASPRAAARAGPKDGDLFSKTATSYSDGISDGLAADCGASGSSSAGGRKARFWREAAIDTQSPVSTSRRMVAVSGRGPSCRASTERSGPSDVPGSS